MAPGISGRLETAKEPWQGRAPRGQSGAATAQRTQQDHGASRVSRAGGDHGANPQREGLAIPGSRATPSFPQQRCRTHTDTTSFSRRKALGLPFPVSVDTPQLPPLLPGLQPRSQPVTLVLLYRAPSPHPQSCALLSCWTGEHMPLPESQHASRRTFTLSTHYLCYILSLCCIPGTG